MVNTFIIRMGEVYTKAPLGKTKALLYAEAYAST